MAEKGAKKLSARRMEACIGCYSCMLSCARSVYGDFSPAKSAIHIRSSGGLQGRFVADMCRGCQKPACAEACSIEAISPRQGGGVRYDKEKCIGCKSCIEACSVHAINFDKEEGKPIVCIQCGICVKNCPHEVLIMEGNDYEKE